MAVPAARSISQLPTSASCWAAASCASRLAERGLGPAPLRLVPQHDDAAAQVALLVAHGPSRHREGALAVLVGSQRAASPRRSTRRRWRAPSAARPRRTDGRRGAASAAVAVAEPAGRQHVGAGHPVGLVVEHHEVAGLVGDDHALVEAVEHREQDAALPVEAAGRGRRWPSARAPDGRAAAAGPWRRWRWRCRRRGLGSADASARTTTITAAGTYGRFISHTGERLRCGCGRRTTACAPRARPGAMST